MFLFQTAAIFYFVTDFFSKVVKPIKTYFISILEPYNYSSMNNSTAPILQEHLSVFFFLIHTNISQIVFQMYILLENN